MARRTRVVQPKPVDKHKAWDVQLHIENTQEYQPALNYLSKYKAKRVANKTFDAKKFEKAVLNTVNSTLMSKHMNNQGYSKRTVNVPTRKAIASAIAKRIS